MNEYNWHKADNEYFVAYERWMLVEDGIPFGAAYGYVAKVTQSPRCKVWVIKLWRKSYWSHVTTLGGINVTEAKAAAKLILLSLKELD